MAVIESTPYPNGISYFSTQDQFIAGSWFIPINADYSLVLDVVSEDFIAEGRNLSIERINVRIRREADGVSILCPNIVGLYNEFVSIESNNPDMQGKHITYATAGDWRVVVNG